MQALIRLVGVVMMLTALAVAWTQAPDRSVESLVARWAPPPSDFMLVKGQLVHFRDEGPRDDATPLVLLHGTAASLHTWQGWVGDLRARKRVITFDLPGFWLTGPFIGNVKGGGGGSGSGDYAPDDYRGDTLARFTLDVMDALHVQRFVIGGNSLGGQVAWRVATLAPARVSGLILVDAAGYPLSSERLPVGLRVARSRVVGGLVGWVGQYLTPRSLIEQGIREAYGDPSRVTSALVDRYFELLTRDGNRRALNVYLHDFGSDLATDRIRTLRVPTLILWGGRDRLISASVARQFQRDIADSQLVVFPALGHVPQEEDAPQSVVPVRVFLGLDKPSAKALQQSSAPRSPTAPAAPAASEPA